MSFESTNIIIEEFKILKDDKVIPLTPEEVLNFEVFEAITAPFITGRLVITHRKGIEELLPITGDEIVVLKFRSRGKETSPDPLNDLRFRVFAGREETIGSDRQNYQRTYRLFLADEQFVNSINKEYSRSFREQNVSKMVQHIAEKMMGVTMGVVEETKYDTNYIMSYVTPHQAIMDISSSASSVSHDDGGYVFFQNTQGGHQFRSLSSLFQQTPSMRLVPNAQNPLYEGNVQRWERLMDFDILRAIRERTIGFTMVGWDKFTKKIATEKIAFDEFFDRTVTLGSVAPFSPERINTQAVMLRQGGDDKWFHVAGRDRMKRSMIKQSRLKIHMQGTSKLSAGQVVDFYIDSQNSAEMENQKLTGKYLIESLNHIWNDSHYIQVMTIIRDSYSTLARGNLVRTSKNVGVG